MVDTLGTTQSDWNKKSSTTGNTTAPTPGDFANPTSRPSDNSTTGIFVLPDSGDLPGLNNLSLKFHGKNGGSPPDDGNSAEAYVWLLSKSSGTSEYCGTYIGKLRITFGDTAGAGGTGSVYATDDYFACDIIAVDDLSLQPPGMRTTANDLSRGIAVLTFDTIGAQIIVMRLRIIAGMTQISVAHKSM